MIHPRRLKGAAANLARYYAVGDYYTKGGTEQSEWGGRIAEDLGLEGTVDPAIFQDLLAGKVRGQQLGRHGRDAKLEHQPGWDFAVNAPKSVSILGLVVGDERIMAAHERAVGVAISYLEEHATLRHRSSGEIVYETTGRLLFARFTEHASRELDPHLHTHVVIMNMTNRGNGQMMASLESRGMFIEQMTAGQVYRNELAHSLKGLGYEIEFDPKRGLFEVKGVPRDLIERMSQRAGQIDEHAREHGLTGQAARRISFYETRGAKESVSLDELHARWLQRAGPELPTLQTLHKEANQPERQAPDRTPDAAGRAGAMLFGIRQVESRETVNNLGQFLRSALAYDVGEIRLQDIRPLVQEHEKRRKLLATKLQTGDQTLIQGRTSRQSARLEQALSTHLVLSLNDVVPIAERDRFLKVAEQAGLNPAQEAALVHIGTATDRLVGVHGVAGAGKSTLVDALRQAAPVHLKLVALAPTSSAAANLGKTAGIESRTVASLLAGGGRDIGGDHILILDEAGQLGNRQALRMLQISRESGARLILLGDNSQTGAIEQGKPFWLLQKLGLSKAELPESVRQETRNMKAAVAQARLKHYAASLAGLDKVVSGAKAEDLASQLVQEWTRLGSDSRAKTNILVLENATRILVNAKVRDVLKAEGAVGRDGGQFPILTPAGYTNVEKRLARFYSRDDIVLFSRERPNAGIQLDTEYRVVGRATKVRDREFLTLEDPDGQRVAWDTRRGAVSDVRVFRRDERELARGDRIQWRLVNHELGIRNADRGTVIGLDGSIASIRWDRGGPAQEVDLLRHKNWDHGYAETVYSAQSKTYDRVYVLAPVNSALVTGQNYYTAITRARFGVKLWTEDAKRLVDKLERHSGEKSSALEGLGRLDRDSAGIRMARDGARFDQLREQQRTDREARTVEMANRQGRGASRDFGLAAGLAGRARSATEYLDRWLETLLSRGSPQSHDAAPQSKASPDSTTERSNRQAGRHDR